MKKSIIIFFILILIGIVVTGLFCLNKNKKENPQTASTNDIANEQPIQNNTIYSETEKRSELPQIPKDKLIQGIVELNHDGRIFIFNGQHFGEFGFEMEEYTEAHIPNNKQKCIDYVTHIEHDMDYLEEGDILIYSKDTLKEENDKSEFIVLKAKDHEAMKREALNNERDHIITIGEYYDNNKELYLKYSISDENYNFPFVIKVNLSDDVKILGKLEEGITVNVKYKELNVPLDKLEVQSIEIIEY